MDLFNGYSGLGVFGALGVAFVGALSCVWRTRRMLVRQSIPANWPMAGHRLVSVEECQVWHWMCKSFPEHQVNLKIPVTRFTRPTDREQGSGLYKLLNGVYCTFTVCTPDGYVVGCADVLGVNGLASKNRQLKQAVLAQCGIAYCVLRPFSLPSTAAIRSELLGEKSTLEPVCAPSAPAIPSKSREERHREFEESLMAEARLKLSAALSRQRRIRDSDFALLTPTLCVQASVHAGQNSFEGSDANLLPGWQRNSFLAPLER